jgi:integrase/recombinase XerD
MEEQLSAFLTSLEAEQDYSPNTIAAYRNDLGQFVSFVQERFTNLADWASVTDEQVESYVQDMRQQTYASSSIARKVAAVKSFFHFLFARSIIPKDPTTKIESPKVKKRKPQTLSHEDVESLLRAPLTGKGDKKIGEAALPAKNLRDAALLALLYATGMRVTEVVTLNLAELDLEQSMLNCVGKDGQVRELPFGADVHHVLQVYLEKGRPYLAKGDDEPALFLNHRGQQLTRQGLWLIIKAYAKEANLQTAVTPHTLRHSFAAHKLHNGTNLQEVQHLLGHANISTTQIYTQLEAETPPEEAAEPEQAA